MHTYTHTTASPLYTSTHHNIERLSRNSWAITSPVLDAALYANSYTQAKAIAAGIDFGALMKEAANPEPVATVEAAVIETAAVEVAAVNPFDAILTEAAQITDLGTMQPAYDQAVRECDLCAVLGHLDGHRLGAATRICLVEAVEDARGSVPDYARVTELAGLLVSAPLLDHIESEARALARGGSVLADLIESLCDLPDTVGYIKRALMLWAVSADRLQNGASWVARLRLEGAALRHAREVAFVTECERADREWVEPKRAQDMGRDSARDWARVCDVAMSYDANARVGAKTFGDVARVHGEVVDRVGELLPSLLSPEPEHWIPVGDGRVLVINWRAGEVTGEVISAAVWLDDGGLSLLGSYVLGSGWVSDDRLREEDVDSEALGVILEAIASAGLATIA